MKAVDSTIKNLLEGVKQFVVPVYQRQYTWSPDDRKTKAMTVVKMWNDINELIDTDLHDTHFFGSIVTFQVSSSASGVSRYVVIDGQQRLISVSLLLAAIRDAARELNVTDGHYIHFVENLERNYIFNDLREGEERYRIIPTKLDKENYFNLLDNSIDDNAWDKITRSFYYFSKGIEKNFTDNSLTNPHEKIRYLENLQNVLLNQLKIVDVSLQGQDDPHDVFESLNYTGIPLTNWDLVRNYVLMQYNDPKLQDEKYITLISPIQESIEPLNDEFLRNFVGLHGKVTTTRNIYNNFKLLVPSDPLSVSNEDWERKMEELKKTSKIFNSLYNPSELDNTGVADAVRFTTEVLEVSTHLPVLMKLFLLYDERSINAEQLESSMNTIRSYLVRRTLYYGGTQGLNKFFPTVAVSLDTNSETQLKESLTRGYYAAPDDDTFYNLLLRYRFDTFPDVKLIRNLLYLIEKDTNREVPNIDGLQLEHIMPQTLNENWKRDLGTEWERVYSQYISNIGNLTITGYNPEMQNYSFERKKSMHNGYCDSSIRMTRALCSRERWDENEITVRAQDISRQLTNMLSI